MPSSNTCAGGRVLAGGRAWAGATASCLPVSALEALCTPCEPPAGAPPGPPLAPLQRFLACVYMKRTLLRFVQQEEYVCTVVITRAYKYLQSCYIVSFSKKSTGKSISSLYKVLYIILSKL